MSESRGNRSAVVRNRIVFRLAISGFLCTFNVWGAFDLNGLVLVSNKPVQKAIVGVHRSSIDGPLAATESHFAVTDAEGRFQVAGLNNGPFVICVTAAGQEILDPCEWTRPMPIYRLPSGTVQVTVQKGATLRIRLDDPERLLPTATRPRTGVAVEPGVRTPDKEFHRAALRSSDRTGHNFEIVVPAEVGLESRVDVLGVQVIDEVGFPVPKGVGAPTTAHGGQLNKTQTYRLAPLKR